MRADKGRSTRCNNGDMSLALPAGVVTILLTEVVGSAQLWESAPTDMDQSMHIHDGIVADAVAAEGGVLLKARDEGDSTFSVFARASDATRSAYRMQSTLSHQAWPASAPLQVRVALHAGEASERDGEYVGTTVNRAASLRTVAHGGEVLLSAAVAQLVADHLPIDVTLDSLGRIRLRDLDRMEEVFALRGPGLKRPRIEIRSRGEPEIDRLAMAGVSRRERDVLDALAERLTNAEIAARFNVSERTVESHVSSLLRKLGGKSRIELAARARELLAVAGAPELPPMLEMSVKRSGCFGRDPERGLLLGCWEDAASGHAALAVVSGEAGIGKSRLVAELASDVHIRGGRVLYGAATDGAQSPYQPLAEALRGVVEGASESQLRADVGRHADVLTRLIPDIATRLGSSRASARLDPLAERLELHIGIEELLIRSARRHPTLLVLEDLHWASPATRDAVLHLARTVGSAPLLVLVTTRDTAPDLDESLNRWLAEATRLPMTTTVRLTGLDLEAASALMADLGSRVDPGHAQHITDGNPLFLREVATGAQASPTLRDFLADRYARLSEDDLDVVDSAAVLGETFRIGVLAAATSRAVDEVALSLERAAAAGLVEPFVYQPGRYTFVHALFRSVRAESISPGRRMKLHAGLAAALLPHAEDPAVLPDLAYHACIAAPLGGAATAVELAARAGLLMATAGDLGQAAVHYQRGLDVIDLVSKPDPDMRLQLNVRLGEALVVFDRERGQQILRDAARLARRLGNISALADAVCSMPPFAGSVSSGEDDPAFIALAEEALTLLPGDDTQWRPRVMAMLGAHLALGSNPLRGEALGREAIALARRSADPLTLAYALLLVRWQSKSDERDDGLREAFAVGEVCGHRGVAHLAAEALSISARERGNLDEMRDWHERAVERSTTLSLGGLQNEVNAAYIDGDLDLAEALNRRTLERDRQLGTGHLYSGPTFILLELWRGRTHVHLMEPFVTSSTHVGSAAQPLLAFSELCAGDLAAASARLTSAREAGLDRMQHRMGWSFALAMWAEVAAAVDDVEAAVELLPQLEPYAGCLADSRGTVWCTIDFARSRLACCLGEFEEAEALADGAVVASRTRNTPLFLGRELVALADARARLGVPAVELEPLIDEARAIADRAGASIIRSDLSRFALPDKA